MSFATSIREEALILSGRHCCLCHKFCGTKIELHHIVHHSEDGDDSLSNCIPLCFDCHADMRSYDHKHPKGTKYTISELFKHRDNWYAKVSASPSVLYNQRSHAVDCVVFERIRNALPYREFIRFLELHDFGGAFHPKIFNQMDEFVLLNEDPSNEFLDTDLEGIRVKLFKTIDEFGHYLALNTWSTYSGLQSVSVDWEDTQPERLVKVISKLHEMSSSITEIYALLVREARRKLGIN